MFHYVRPSIGLQDDNAQHFVHYLHCLPPNKHFNRKHYEIQNVYRHYIIITGFSHLCVCLAVCLFVCVLVFNLSLCLCFPVCNCIGVDHGNYLRQYLRSRCAHKVQYLLFDLIRLDRYKSDFLLRKCLFTSYVRKMF